ncbi:hypothetical protein [Nitratifractor sp.]
MKIAFSKVGRSPGDFRYQREGVALAGTLQRTEAHRVELDGEIEGELELECDRCGERYREALELPLVLHLSDRPLPIGEDLDTVEFLDGMIDIERLLESEITAYRSEYHYCPKCRAEDREIDLEY